jgi:hypothetical protein
MESKNPIIRELSLEETAKAFYMHREACKYLDKLDEIDVIRLKKCDFAKKQDYENAAEERNKESIACAESEFILNEMRKFKK